MADFLEWGSSRANGYLLWVAFAQFSVYLATGTFVGDKNRKEPGKGSFQIIDLQNEYQFRPEPPRPP